MTEFADGEFSVVLDKGTLDAMATDESEVTQTRVCEMFGEIGRVLRVGGRYVCISLAQPHILAAVLRYFTDESVFDFHIGPNASQCRQMYLCCQTLVGQSHRKWDIDTFFYSD